MINILRIMESMQYLRMSSLRIRTRFWRYQSLLRSIQLLTSWSFHPREWNSKSLSNEGSQVNQGVKRVHMGEWLSLSSGLAWAEASQWKLCRTIWHEFWKKDATFRSIKMRKTLSRRHSVSKMPQSSTARGNREGGGAGMDCEHPVGFKRM